MNFLPVVDRELRVASRSRLTHRSRFVAGFIAAFVIAGMTLTMGFTSLPSQVGGSVFSILNFLLTWFCLIGGVMTTFDSISEERRQGTLGLLFLTPLRNIDLILGKLTSASLNVFFGAIAVMPVLAITLVLGGVTLGEVWRVSLGLLIILLFGASLGMFVSSIMRDASKSLLLAFGLLAAFLLAVEILSGLQQWLAGIRFFTLEWLSPPRLTSFARDKLHSADPARFWLASSCIGGLSLALLASTTRRTAHFRIDQTEAKPHLPSKRFRRRATAAPKWLKDKGQREELLQENPVIWLEASSSQHASLLRILIIASGVIMAGFLILGATVDDSIWIWGPLIAGFILNLGLKVWLAVAACQSFNEARRTGELDMLLTTPLRPERVVEGHREALTKIFQPAMWKILAIQSAPILGTFHLIALNGGDSAASLLFLTCFIVALIADFHALLKVGLWNGLVYPKMHIALGRTVFAVLGVPWLIALVPCFGWMLFLCSPIYSAILANRAEERFFNHFPRIVTEPGAFRNGKPIAPSHPPMPVRRPAPSLTPRPREDPS